MEYCLIEDFTDFIRGQAGSIGFSCYTKQVLVYHIPTFLPAFLLGALRDEGTVTTAGDQDSLTLKLTISLGNGIGINQELDSKLCMARIAAFYQAVVADAGSSPRQVEC